MNCTGDYVAVPGTLDIFFTGLGILVSGLFVGLVSVATLVYKSSIQEADQETPYEQKYYEEFSEMDERKLDDEEISGLKEKFVCETTPNGDVIICYNKVQESFDVWHDDRNIPFMILDAVAQHYAIEHDVKAICVDYKHAFDQAVAKMKEANEEKENKDEDNKEEKKSDDVFAKFKTYNTASEKGKSVDNKIVTDKCNRFRRVGDIKEWHDAHDKEDEGTEDSKKRMSYEQFKSIHESSKLMKNGSEEDKKEK